MHSWWVIGEHHTQEPPQKSEASVVLFLGEEGASNIFVYIHNFGQIVAVDL